MATFSKVLLSGSTNGRAIKVASTPTTATITGVSASAGTITYTATNTFANGQIVSITGVNPNAYNLTNATIATATGSNFTITNAATGTYVSGGTATRQDMPAGTTIHATGTSSSVLDEVWLYAYNSDTASRLLVIQYGAATFVDDDIRLTIPPQSGLTLVVAGLLLRGTGAAASTISAYASVANVVTITGYVNRIA